MSPKMVTDNALVITEQLLQLSELSTKIFSRLDPETALAWLCDEPIFDAMVSWFGDPRFTVPEFSWN